MWFARLVDENCTLGSWKTNSVDGSSCRTETWDSDNFPVHFLFLGSLVSGPCVRVSPWDSRRGSEPVGSPEWRVLRGSSTDPAGRPTGRYLERVVNSRESILVGRADVGRVVGNLYEFREGNFFLLKRTTGWGKEVETGGCSGLRYFVLGDQDFR